MFYRTDIRSAPDRLLAYNPKLQGLEKHSTRALV